MPALTIFGFTMIGRMFDRTRRSPRPHSARGAANKRCYVIGDVHGRSDLLAALLETIREHNATRPERETVVVTLGDLIDRGPGSREVVELLMRPLPLAARLVCLKGNHEEILLRGLGGEPELLLEWLRHGGLECAQSYGISSGLLRGQAADVLEHNLGSAIPQEHLRFLASFADSARFGDYLLVHAGIRPGVTVEAQSPADLRWIRKGFLDNPTDHGFIVVHGHSISLEVEEAPNRIGIDTGAYKTGVLTALWLEDGERGYLQATDALLQPV